PWPTGQATGASRAASGTDPASGAGMAWRHGRAHRFVQPVRRWLCADGAEEVSQGDPVAHTSRPAARGPRQPSGRHAAQHGFLISTPWRVTMSDVEAFTD